MVLYEVDLGLLDGPSSTVQGGGLFLLHRMFALFTQRGKQKLSNTSAVRQKLGLYCS